MTNAIATTVYSLHRAKTDGIWMAGNMDEVREYIENELPVGKHYVHNGAGVVCAVAVGLKRREIDRTPYMGRKEAAKEKRAEMGLYND